MLELLDVTGGEVQWLHIPSHIGIRGDERADGLADEGRQKSPLLTGRCLLNQQRLTRTRMGTHCCSRRFLTESPWRTTPRPPPPPPLSQKWHRPQQGLEDFTACQNRRFMGESNGAYPCHDTCRGTPDDPPPGVMVAQPAQVTQVTQVPLSVCLQRLCTKRYCTFVSGVLTHAHALQAAVQS